MVIKMTRARRILVVLSAFMVALGVTVVVQPAAASAASGSPVKVQINGYCLDADLNTINRDGTIVQLWQCNGSNQQRWYRNADGTIHTSYNTDYCLDVDLNTANVNGGKAQLWRCNGSPQQKWSNFNGQLRSGWNNRCLDADLNTLNRNGTKVQMWDCNNSSQQTWNGLGSSWQTNCSPWGNEQVWQTSSQIGRVRERVCVKHDAASVWGVVEFQVDFPGSCSLAIGLPPTASVSCGGSWAYKTHQLMFNSVQVTGNLWVPKTGQWNQMRCTWGHTGASSTLTFACHLQAATRISGPNFTVDVHNTGADVNSDSDGTKLLLEGHYNFVL